jgi:hypothetical protein
MRVIQSAISALLIVVANAAAIEVCASPVIPSSTTDAAATTPVVRMSSREAPATQVTPLRPGADLMQAVVAAQDINFPPLTVVEHFKKAIAAQPQAVIGIGRSSRAFGIQSSAGRDEPSGSVAFRVSSPGAKHLRAGLSFSSPGTYLVTTFSPGQQDRSISVTHTLTDNVSEELLWSGLSDGDTQFIVVERTAAAGPWSASVQLISHFSTDLLNEKSAFQPEGLGDSAPCQIDFVCLINAATPTQQTELLLASRAVTLMIFTDTNGASESCTGTMLNSASYPAPLVITAFHCVANADNLITLWFYSRTTCGSGPPSPYTQVTGGGHILFQDASLDAALIQLNSIPPSPASYSGWDPAAITSTTQMLAISHPVADVKKASFGQVVGTNPNPISFQPPLGTFPTGFFYMVNWEAGFVQPGSSGSGLFTFGDPHQFYYLRGTLTGGPTNASCSSPNPAYYNQLAEVYPHISAALTQSSPPPPPPPSVNYSGLWWNSPAGSESGWGINFSHQGNIIFATWFTYDLSGNFWWLSMTANQTANNTFSGTLYQTNGPSFDSVPFDPAAVKATPVGTATLTFSDANDGTFAYTVNSVNQVKAITRQVFGPLPTCVWGAQPNLALATNVTGLWWAAPGGIEAGWGINFSQQGNIIFATWFTYNGDGTPAWASATANNTAPGVYTGSLYWTSGPAFDAVPFLPTNVSSSQLGTATFTFFNGNSGSFAYTVNTAEGPVTQTKSITQQVFAAPGTACQ